MNKDFVMCCVKEFELAIIIECNVENFEINILVKNI